MGGFLAMKEDPIITVLREVFLFGVAAAGVWWGITLQQEGEWVQADNVINSAVFAYAVYLSFRVNFRWGLGIGQWIFWKVLTLALFGILAAMVAAGLKAGV